MKFYVSVILAIFLPISLTNADSWTLKKGQYYTSHGIYHTLPTSANSYSLLNFKYSYLATSQAPPFDQQIIGATLPLLIQIKINTAKIAYPFELHYGYRDDLTIFTKMDIAKAQEKFALNITNGKDGLVEKLIFPADYFIFESCLGFRKKHVSAIDQAITTEWAFSPGEFKYDKYSYFKQNSSATIEGRLLYGKNFKPSIFLTTQKSYFELQLVAKYYFRQQHLELGCNFHIGLRPVANWLIVFAINNQLSKLNDVKRNIPNIELFLKGSALFPAKANIKDIQRTLTAINNGLNSYRHSLSYSCLHRLSIKTAYLLNRDSAIGLEHSITIDKQSPVIHYTMMLKFENYF